MVKFSKVCNPNISVINFLYTAPVQLFLCGFPSVSNYGSTAATNTVGNATNTLALATKISVAVAKLQLDF